MTTDILPKTILHPPTGLIAQWGAKAQLLQPRNNLGETIVSLLGQYGVEKPFLYQPSE